MYLWMYVKNMFVCINYVNVYCFAKACIGSVKTKAGIKEFDVFQTNYALLRDTMTDIDDLLKHFVADKIITITEEEEIKFSTSKSEKVRKVLLHIVGPLKAGNVLPFNTMLEIMKNYGVNATRLLAEDMLKDLKGNYENSNFLQHEQRGLLLLILYAGILSYLVYVHHEPH